MREMLIGAFTFFSITKLQSLGEIGQSEKRGQGHSEAQVRLQMYYTGGLFLKNMLRLQYICDAVFLSRWFEGFNWDGLCTGTLNPPLIPKVKHTLHLVAY